ncbi:unnamed protein product [Moneuplotes crassus]|uniref:Uncharacterized protein n=1 Tax=Euplotes crassus TaxID=5936 RepID=A0AAD1XRH1_EUPCR|nr:unnamed protein product [Moneuplotes crassus]
MGIMYLVPKDLIKIINKNINSLLDYFIFALVIFLFKSHKVIISSTGRAPRGVLETFMNFIAKLQLTFTESWIKLLIAIRLAFEHRVAFPRSLIKRHHLKRRN